METKQELVKTMEQAIEEGYTHFLELEGENLLKFRNINPNDRQYFKEGEYYLVDMKSPVHYSIDAKTISELISGHVEDQDEMGDENGKLFAIAEEHDYSEVAKQLNEKFSKVNFYEPTDIRVIF